MGRQHISKLLVSDRFGVLACIIRSSKIIFTMYHDTHGSMHLSAFILETSICSRWQITQRLIIDQGAERERFHNVQYKRAHTY